MLQVRIFIITLLLFIATLNALAARDRAAAREAYREAVDYYGWLSKQPLKSRQPRHYRRSIFLFLRVVDHDPTYGACDDSLYGIAQLYDEMAQNFRSQDYKARALYYYEFVANEYPLTRFKAAAKQRAEELRNPAADPRQNPQEQTRSEEGLAVLSEIRYWSSQDYTRVVLQLDREVEFDKSVLRNPDRIYFDLREVQLDPRLVDQRYDVNGLFLKQIRVGENRPEIVRVVLDFDEINQHTVFALYDPFRIVIDTRGSPAKSAGAERDGSDEGVLPESDEDEAALSNGAPSPTLQGDWTLTRTLGLKVGRVVIDPGHGGKDTGTIGPGGLLEKDLVLDVAHRLRQLLAERLGTDVILTRQDDRFVPLEERTAIANQNNADLFISIHANSSRNRKVAGVETYVLDFATTEAEREAASRENASSQRNIRELENLLRQIALGDYNRESRDLAHVVQRNLVDQLSDHLSGQKDRGVKQAPFIVLIGSGMPSILTEIGFISNPLNEKYFKSELARGQVAEALYQGIEEYFRSLGTLPNPPHTASVSGQ